VIINNYFDIISQNNYFSTNSLSLTYDLFCQINLFTSSTMWETLELMAYCKDLSLNGKRLPEKSGSLFAVLSTIKR